MTTFTPGEWHLVGQLSFGETATALPATFPQHLETRIIKVTTLSRSTPKIVVKPTWRRAGYLTQMIGAQEVCSRVIPLNAEKILLVPLMTPSYQLRVTPVRWLPNLSIRVYAFAGDANEEDEVLAEAQLI